MPTCQTNFELMEKAQAGASLVAEITLAIAPAKDRRDHEQVSELEKKLVDAFSESERAMVAWRAHAKEHGC